MKHFEDPQASIAQSGLEHALQHHMVMQGQAEHADEVDHEEIHQHEAMLALNHMLEVRSADDDIPDKPPPHLAVHQQVWNALQLYLAFVEAKLAGDTKRANMLRERLKFSAGDVGWLDALTEYLEAFDGDDGHRIPYRRWQDLDQYVVKGFQLPLKVALIGDWGTGTRIARQVLQLAVSHEPDVIVHMGDVYYAGTRSQYRQKLHKLIDELAIKDGVRIPVYNLAGNHDMYSGGDAYYESLDTLNAGELQQGASYFALDIADGQWQLLGCDTAYHDHDPFTVNIDVTRVSQHEQEWLQHQVDRIASIGGRCILLSHHQPFSSFEAIGALSRKSPLDYWVNPELMSMHDRLSARGDVAAWFWGHEHRMAVYREYAGIAKGRCIGHGAIPILTSEDPYEVIAPDWRSLPFALLGMIRGKWRPHTFKSLFALSRGLISGRMKNPPELQTDAEGRPLKLKAASEGIMYRHGFAILDFKVSGATASYFDDEQSEPMYVEQL